MLAITQDGEVHSFKFWISRNKNWHRFSVLSNKYLKSVMNWFCEFSGYVPLLDCCENNQWFINVEIKSEKFITTRFKCIVYITIILDSVTSSILAVAIRKKFSHRFCKQGNCPWIKCTWWQTERNSLHRESHYKTAIWFSFSYGSFPNRLNLVRENVRFWLAFRKQRESNSNARQPEIPQSLKGRTSPIPGTGKNFALKEATKSNLF